MVRYRNGFRSQWRAVLPSTNPQVTYDDYRDDPKFMADLAGVMTSGVPYVFAHIALGKTMSEGREFDLDNRGRKLMDSLRNITGAEIYKTTDFVSLSRDDALKMCSTPSDCHPSEFGHNVYAEVVSKMVLLPLTSPGKASGAHQTRIAAARCSRHEFRRVRHGR